METERDGTPSPDEIFGSYLAKRYAGEPVDFTSLCAAHPGIEDELRRIERDYRRTLELLDRFGMPTFAARMREKHGANVDRAVGLTPKEQPAPNEDRARERRSRYEVRGEIGRGGMGAVLHVWDDDLRRSLAMKVVLDDAANQQGLARFLEEAQVTGQLDHPGIVPVHEVGLDQGGRVYFTMRLVKGKNLREISDLANAEKDGWNQTRALNVLLRVCEAMAFAHEKGVIHRDLKPGNVMVGRFGETYVMDWGLARVLDEKDRHDIRLRHEGFSSLTAVATNRDEEREQSPESPLVTMDGDVVGTPAYMPPEQAKGQVSEVGPRADVYAVGAMLYHLLAAQPPYIPSDAKVSPRTVLEWVINGPPKKLLDLNPKVPAELVAICEKAMAREPKDRYADMLAMADDLRAYLENRVVKAHRTGAVVEFKKWVTRHKGMAAGLAASVMILAVGLATTITFYGREREQRELASEQANRANGEAERATREAKRALSFSRMLSLSAVERLQALRARAERELWPRRSDKVELMEGWLEDAQGEVEQRPQYETYLAEVEASSQSDEGKWLAEKLGELIGEVQAFESGLIGEVAARLAVARTMEQKTIDANLDAWNACISAIAEDPRFAGLELEPQEGLVPLEKDPRTGLYEFWVYETGERPERDQTTKKWIITGETGMVLVFLPGGTRSMGAQKDDPSKPNYDPECYPHEGPVHEVTLAPFFLSKYEMTQGQWERTMGVNPSHQKLVSQTNPMVSSPSATLAHPIQNVSYVECEAALLRLGLVLPTEAQWEYAARGGTNSPWWTGATKETLKGRENIADQSHLAAFPDARRSEAWQDGFGASAPVGSLGANGFGLYDVAGNVWEWCRDWYGPYSLPVSEAHGERLVADGASFRVDRGGSYLASAIDSRSTDRDPGTPSDRNGALGVRPAWIRN